ncbi:hypothetical protein Mal15_11000 [Stieleria maiorica]|uniref:DUF1559 domain-containing protein n=1 Tax=Stieleria maiorica TaxID=2795974 RepID=A0A5B9MBZ0_9BACT|nr:DUF1559 domain-containing protein [Stieleria maiorica]QEF97065.1 hypothetical protein Mal15_11000 [Stieleria maiorica]
MPTTDQSLAGPRHFGVATLASTRKTPGIHLLAKVATFARRLILSTLATIASLAVTATPASAVDSATVLSVVDENAIVVVRIDPQAFQQLPDAEKAYLRLAGNSLPQHARKTIDPLLESEGGSEAFLLFSASETSQVPFTRDPIVVVPAASGQPPTADADPGQTKQVGSVIITGNLSRLNVDRLGKPSAAQDVFRDAFTALGPAPLQFAVYLNSDRRRAIKEFGLAELETLFPIDSSQLAGVDWVSGSAYPDGQAGLEFVFHVADAGDAKVTRSAIRESIKDRLPAPFQMDSSDQGEDRTLRLKLGPQAGSRQLQVWSSEAKRKIADSRLRRIALGLHNYHSAFSRLPSPVIADDQGRPLLSWRVALLPFLGKDEYRLYQEFHLDEPWDSPHNRPLADQMPDVFAIDASAASGNRSDIVIPVGEGLFFDGDEPKFGDVIDGISNTIMVFETPTEQAEIWSKPANPTPTPANLDEVLGGHFGDQAVIVHGDGSIHWIKPQTIGKSLWARFTRNGKEPID